ncbi:phospholipid/cholesterol/gamma-HCH transport system substrate-binding protein [Saccharomonospora amisosensis]|uniref:Phospholipid/cholesterol/gamma-HCH transport system substrate-binding protein n=1 Tax=Saccharomonospora amisosensis TaxID=1128677 RepID=A0A7X5UQR6_9PSEU|nr:MCE family protein [Saccharomonospora amisosensis]NIJ12043.1 phospholipid/cholesterol/gamma-HCH transport system substrate-binding protein [Saccharomonospora amisosensis]
MNRNGPIRRITRGVAIACVLALAAGVAWHVLLRPESESRVSAEFPSADGIFPGSRVAILGVPLGTVESVEPRGSRVRVTMTLPGDVAIPEGVHAYIMSPAVISDRFVELSPAYTGGPELPDGAGIPVERAHAPIKWDELAASLDQLLDALGPDKTGAGGIGALVSATADTVGGNGQRFRDAIHNIAQASDLVAAQTPDIGAVLDNVESLSRLLVEHRSTVDTVTDTVSAAAADFAEQQDAVAASVEHISRALGTLGRLLREHGDQLSGDLSKLTDVSTTLVARQRELAETLDTLPLALQNFGLAVKDNRLRIRLDVSTNLSQFPTTAKLCRQLPLPLCEGAGVVNPIPFPPRIPDALGLDGAMNGGGG